MVSEERLEQLERSLHLAGNALQAANNRIASLESAAGTSTAAASMVDMRVLGKPSIFAGDEASWKSWSFVMLSFSAAVSPELRALMEKARTNVADMLNVKLTAAEQVWSRQLYYMLSLSTSGEAQRRLQNVPEGEGAEAWKVFSEHYEPKTATRYVGMLRQILLYDFGELTQLIDRIEQFRHLVRKYEEQSGESVTDNVRQAVFQAGIKDAAIRDHLALHAGRLNSFDKMAAEVSTVARTRSENDVVPMDVSVLKGKGGKGKDGKGKEGKGKEGKGKTKAKDDRDKFDPKSSSNKFKKCFYCDKVGHVRADCRKKKRDDEERRNMSAQNSLNSSSASMSPPGLTNITTNTSGASSSSLRQLTIPSYVSDDEFHSPMRIFALRDNSNVDRVMVDSGAAHSACPSDYANEHEVREVQRKIQFQTASGELLEHHGEKLVPYMAQDSVMGITYQVTDVEGPVAAVSSMNDGGMTVVFSPQGAWVCDETPLKPAGSIELKRENRTFWMDLPRADSDQVQRMMALRHEQPVEQVERIAGNPAIEEKRQGIPASADPTVQDNEDTPVARARKPPPGPTTEELDKHELTHVVFRSWCKHCISGRAKEDPHRSVATHEGRTPKVMLDWMFFTSDQEPGVQLPVLVVYDLSTGAVMAMQSTKDSSVATVGAVVQTLETWGHTDVVLHADGEPATKSLVRSVANARVHRTLPRHGPPHSHQSQGPVEACIQVYRGIFVANKLALEAGIGCRLLLKHPAIVWLIRHAAWLITRYNTGRDGCSPFRRIFGKPYNGSICKFGEQVHYKLSGHPSSRVEPRWELGAWVGKTELTDEHLLGTLSGIRNSRTIYRLPKSHCYSKDALDRIVGTPVNPKPEGAAKDPQIRRQYITQRWVDEHGSLLVALAVKVGVR